MKRSQINSCLVEGRKTIEAAGFHLPGFASLAPEVLIEQHSAMPGVFDNGLGWDITDYGKGAFDETGLFLFTVRNGSLAELKSGGMCYAEKIMISRRDQISPMHRHVLKTEDIINRSGAKLAIRMFESNEEGALDPERPVTVELDARIKTLKAGDTILLNPGESVTLRPGNWHEFWGEGGDVVIGEVSTVNDDLTDNIFIEPLNRFSTIEEDEPPLHLLVSDYGKWLK